jgi:hypothetical protein
MGPVPIGRLHRRRVRPWLPYGDNAARNVAQRDDPESMLQLSRELIALRSAAFAGRIASYRQLPGPPGVWAYQVNDLVVTGSFSGYPAEVHSCSGPVIATSAGPGALDGATLAPWTGIITQHGSDTRQPPAGE